MKKFIATILTAALTLGCTACSFTSSSDGKTEDYRAEEVCVVNNANVAHDEENFEYVTHAYPEGVNKYAKNLILDNKFTQGMEMLGHINNGGKDWLSGYYMTLGDTTDTSKTQWQLAEWLSKSTLAHGTESNANYTYTKDGDTHTYKNDHKLVAINPVEGSLTLGVNGIAEYGDAERPLAGTGTNNWAHLLAAYSSQIVKLDTITDTKVYIDFKIDSLVQSTAFTPTVPGEQAAQFVLYFVIRNDMDKDYVWFGIPLYDNREEDDPFVYGELFQWDIASSSIIYSVPKNEYFETQPIVGERYTKLIDIDDSIKYCTQQLVAQGVWPSNTSRENLSLEFSNIGWEVPGTINCQATIYNFSCFVI